MKVEPTSIAIGAVLLILLAMTFCSPRAKAQTWDAQDVTGPKCVSASKHCWCNELKTPDDIRAEPDRYKRVPDYFGDIAQPSVCVEYVDTQQSAIGGRACVAYRVCYKGSSKLDELIQRHRALVGAWQ